MYCGECGTKLKKGDLFCGECGTKIGQAEEVKTVSKKEISVTNSNPKKTIDKKTKTIIAIVAVVAVVLFGVYQIINNMYSPKEVAKDYIDALINKDASKLYSYLEIEGDKTFVNRKAFKQLLKNEETSVDIENYTITDVKYATGKLSATVTVSYTSKSSTTEKTKTISLAKAKEKKLLFFDNWKIGELSSDSMTVSDYKITVPKKAIITFAGIKVDKKFLDKEKSTDELDVYILPQVFTGEVELKTKLANGMTLTNEVTPSSYRNYYKLSFNLDSLSKSDKKNLTDTFEKDLKTIYKSGIERKTWEDIKATYAKNGINTEDLEKSYNEFVEDLTEASNVLKTINFTDVELSSVSLDDDGNLTVRAKANYKYSVEYTSYNDEVTTHDDSSYSNITFTYKMTGKSYLLVNTRYLTTYFSRY